MENITYKEFIQNIIDTRGRFNCGDEYHERHHIIPRCMNGGDENDNLIDLFAKEHFEAHRLLALENPDNDKLVYAWWMMSHVKTKNQERYEITAEEYEEAKILYGKILSQKMSGENNFWYDIHMYGKDNPFYGKKHSKESREKMSKIRKATYVGEGNPFYGKHHTKETIEILRAKNIGKKDSAEANKKKANYGSDNPSSRRCVAVFDNGCVKKYDMIKSLIEDLNCQNASAYARGVLGSPIHYWKKGNCYIYYEEEYKMIGDKENNE